MYLLPACGASAGQAATAADGRRHTHMHTSDRLTHRQIHAYRHRAHTGTHGHNEVSHGFEPRSLDSESRVLTVTPRGQVIYFVCLLKTGRRVEERGSEAHCQEAEPQPGRKQRLRAELERDLWGSTSARGTTTQKSLGGRRAQLGLEQRPRADLNRDRWIQSPEC